MLRTLIILPFPPDRANLHVCRSGSPNPFTARPLALSSLTKSLRTCDIQPVHLLSTPTHSLSVSNRVIRSVAIARSCVHCENCHDKTSGSWPLCEGSYRMANSALSRSLGFAQPSFKPTPEVSHCLLASVEQSSGQPSTAVRRLNTLCSSCRNRDTYITVAITCRSRIQIQFSNPMSHIFRFPIGTSLLLFALGSDRSWRKAYPTTQTNHSVATPVHPN